MRKFLVLILMVFILTLGFIKYTEAAVRVRGYFRSNGTYVQPHYRSNTDGYRWNNWSVKGNINPYTGKSGKLNPWRW
jgi:hypothetical protein